MSKNKQQRKVLAEDVAMARYSVISPLVCREMTAEEYSVEVARAQCSSAPLPRWSEAGVQEERQALVCLLQERTPTSLRARI